MTSATAKLLMRILCVSIITDSRSSTLTSCVRENKIKTVTSCLKDPEKHKKTSSKLSICHQWFNLTVMKRREYFLLSKMALHWQRDRETNCWINVIISIFFAYKKYSRRFIKFRLNHWWQMDYFEDVFYTFLCLDSVIYLAVNGTDTSFPGFHPKYLKLCFEDERSFYGFGTTSG